METPDSIKLFEEIAFLKEHSKKLEARVDLLESCLTRQIETAHGFDEALKRYCDKLDGELTDAFGRIKNIELKFFPNLASDLDQLHRVIGEPPPEKECPHERRKP